LRCVPGMHVMAPKDENELQHMVYTALYCDKLASVRFPRGEGYGVALDSKLQMLPLGKAERLLIASKPLVSIWAAGSCVYTALEAGKELQTLGVSCEVVNARFIKPLDTDALARDAAQVKLFITVEENSVVGGLGGAVLEALAEKNLSIPVVNLGIPDEFIEHGSVGRLRAYCQIDQIGIVAATLKRLERLALHKVTVKVKEPVKHEAPSPSSNLTH
jgi:1-deoxy-D-xylulose-5-phosphate synthase